MDVSSTTTITTELSDFSKALSSPSGIDEDDENDFANDGFPPAVHENLATSCTSALAHDVSDAQAQFQSLPLTTPTPGTTGEGSKRIAFLFDSTLTAFLMMGNLSSSLKNHAVTLFEVGKLSDESLDSFVEELQNVKLFMEGEAQRYSEHAQTLLLTILALRNDCELDLIRGESLLSLNHVTRHRFISKTYRYVVSMAPLNADACPLSSPSVSHFGPALPEVVSSWFRLYLYKAASDGPISLYIPKGIRFTVIPKQFRRCKRVILTTASHEPVIVPVDSCLVPLNDTLQTHAVLMQEYSSTVDDSEIVSVPFPFEEKVISDDEFDQEEDQGDFSKHPSVLKLRKKLSLDSLCGYLVLLRKGAVPLQGKDTEQDENMTASKDPRKIAVLRQKLNEDETFADYVILDCIFGVPLFDENLNRIICRRIKSRSLLDPSKSSVVQFANHDLAESMRELIDMYQFRNISERPSAPDGSRYSLPTQMLLFDGAKISVISRAM